ncbi:MAG TPA: orotidine-5'-phosphate decarboxylase [Candidatus Saccharimonadales bacterium]
MHTTHDARDWAQAIIVALDVDTKEDATTLLDELEGYNIWIKVGNQLGTAIGWESAINLVHDRGFSIFCDTKYKDIPETVKLSSKAITTLGADMFNVMADTSENVLAAAVEGKNIATTNHKLRPPLLIGVTVLTSLSDNESNAIYGAPAQEKVLQFASSSATAKLDGVVCSAEEAELLRAHEATKNLLLVTPGIRPTWAASGDQSRVMTPKMAIQAGADYLVIGRPITQPPAEVGSPKAALEKIIEELGGKND